MMKIDVYREKSLGALNIITGYNVGFVRAYLVSFDMGK